MQQINKIKSLFLLPVDTRKFLVIAILILAHVTVSQKAYFFLQKGEKVDFDARFMMVPSFISVSAIKTIFSDGYDTINNRIHNC